jgi:hypothetical protein
MRTRRRDFDGDEVSFVGGLETADGTQSSIPTAAPGVLPGWLPGA